MPNMVDGGGRLLPNSKYTKVVAGQTTANISTAGDGVPGRDYISHLIITAASTAAPGAVTLLDGTTSLCVHSFQAATFGSLVETVIIDAVASSTKGFNITTGTSVSVVAVGRF
jgi:hypothetical protein